MTSLSFTSQVDAWVKASKQRMTAVFHKSAEMVAEAVAAGTPIDTGFLIHSFQASGQTMPLIRAGNRPPNGASAGSFTYDAGPVNLAILSVPIGGTIHMGFTADYAVHVEFGANGRPGRAMVRLAAQRWPQIVKEASAAAKAAVR